MSNQNDHNAGSSDAPAGAAVEPNHEHQPMQAFAPQPDRAPARPADTIRDGRLKATIWRNEGQKGAFYSTKIAKTYEDRNGVLKDGQNFSRNDLLKIPVLSQQAYVRIGELQREHTQDYAQSQGKGSQGTGPTNVRTEAQAPAQQPAHGQAQPAREAPAPDRDAADRAAFTEQRARPVQDVSHDKGR